MRPVSQPKLNISQLNLLLIALAMMFLVLYIFNINKIAVLEYSLSSAKTQLAKQNVLTQSLLASQQNSIQDLMAFARTNNMVEVKNYETFFQEAGVALLNPSGKP